MYIMAVENAALRKKLAAAIFNVYSGSLHGGLY